ncbi:hypothetical protein, partial [Mesorhizobium sp. M1A.F.Ca.IN.022.07.1.1]|uniref:hypothetical protein n=1 Tax=Mesorhizobium sp. M1A.F.Ca.IN.022.07.1.1 TaxID=2496767 RepID=UPI0019D2141A
MVQGKLRDTQTRPPSEYSLGKPVAGTSSLNLAASSAKSGENFRTGSRQEPTRERTRMVTYL